MKMVEVASYGSHIRFPRGWTELKALLEDREFSRGKVVRREVEYGVV